MITSKMNKIKPAYTVSVKQLPVRFSRKKVNFMVDEHILIRIKECIPAGERSDFVNGALEKEIIRYRREKAFDAMDELREKADIRMSIKEMLKRKNYGRP